MHRTQSKRQHASASDQLPSLNPFEGHGERLRKSGARVKRLVIQAQRTPVLRKASTGVSDSESEDSEEDRYLEEDSDADIVGPVSQSISCDVDKARVRRLFNKLHVDERDEVLTSVHNDLRIMAATSKRDLEELDNLDLKHERILQEFDLATKELDDEMAQHGEHTLSTMQHFQKTLGGMKEQRENLIGRRQRRKVNDFSEHPELEKMTDEEVAREIERRQKLIDQETKEARDLLRDVAEYQTGQKNYDLQDDIIVEQERLLATVKDTVKLTERRTQAIKQALDHIAGRSPVAENGDEQTLSTDVTLLMKEIQQDVESRLIPELIEERQRENGEDLCEIDDTALLKVKQQNMDLAADIETLQGIVHRLKEAGACEDDEEEGNDEDGEGLSVQGETDETAVEQMIDGILESLSSLSFQPDLDSDEESDVRGRSDALIRAHDANEELQKKMRSNKELYHVSVAALQTVQLEEETVQSDYNARLQGARIVQETIETLSGHHRLFLDALTLARGEAPAGTEEVVRRPSSENVSRSEVALAAVEAVLAAPAKQPEQTANWKDPFLETCLIGQSCQAERNAIRIQSDIVNAFVEEEQHLELRVHVLQGTVRSRMDDIVSMIDAEKSSALLEDMMKFTQQEVNSCEEFVLSRQHLEHSTDDAVRSAFDEDTALFRAEIFSARQKAVQTTRGLPSIVLKMMGCPELAEAFELEAQNRKLAVRVSSLGDQLSLLRGHKEARTEEILKAQKELKVQAELQRIRRQKLGVGPTDEETEVLDSLTATAEMLADTEEARRVRQERRHLAALRLEAQAVSQALDEQEQAKKMLSEEVSPKCENSNEAIHDDA